MGNQQVALKWYFAPVATAEQHANLKALVRKGAPAPDFLWPMDLAGVRGKPGFGYIMPLREPRFKSVIDLMRGRVQKTSFKALAAAGMKLAHAFLQLHAQGLCYRDISFGNVFFDPQTGDISVCDNDNVSVDNQKPSGVEGTARFMAPEVVRQEVWPNTQTDLFSLAVLLFYILVRNNPLEGKKEAAIHCLDIAAMKKLYGHEPVFIFDPADDSNRPVPGVHNTALWPLYPRFLQELFIRTFTRGLHKPTERVRESEWRLAMARLRDCIVYCPGCGTENFHDPFDTQGPPACMGCRRTVNLPVWLEITHDAATRLAVYLNHDTQLYPHHTDPKRRFDFSGPVAEMTPHPQHPNVWGLRNLTPGKWAWYSPEGKAREIEPGRAVGVMNDARIQFGASEGRFRFSTPGVPAQQRIPA